MSFKPIPSPSKVTYFKHFPHYFLRPYDAQQHYNLQEFLEKLSARNCEWMTRPKVAISEAAQALSENWELVKANNFLEPSIQRQMETLLQPMQQVLSNLDVKQKTTQATNQDVYQVMRWCFDQPQLDESLSLWMQQSAAFFVMVTQMGAMRALLTNPEQYATKLVNDSPEAIRFKSEKSVASLQKMLTDMCASFQSIPVIGTTTHLSALAQQLVNPAGAPPMPPGLQAPSNTFSNAPQNLDIPTTANEVQLPVSNTQSMTTPQQPQSTTLNTQLMDMILSLQNQMQQLQQQQMAAKTKEMADNDIPQPQKINKKKRKINDTNEDSQPQPIEPPPMQVDEPSTSTCYEEAEVPQTDEVKKSDENHEVKKSKKQKKDKRKKSR